MKRVFTLLLTLLLVLPLLACAKEGENTPVRVLALNGPTGMGMAKLHSDSDEGKTANEYEFTYAASPDAAVSALMSGEADLAAIPVNLAPTLYQKTEGGVLCLCLCTKGVLYLLEDGDTVHSVADLKGKTILATGQASTPEYILRYVLEKNGIDPDKDVSVVFSSELGAVEKGQIVLLPEPKVTAALTKNPDARIALDMTEEWDKVSGGGLVQGVIAVRREFAEAHPKAVETFLSEFSSSVAFTNGNPDEASVLIEKYGILPKAAIAKKAIPNCNIVCITGSEMKAALTSVYSVLFASSPASIGGKMPDDDFYYQK